MALVSTTGGLQLRCPLADTEAIDVPDRTTPVSAGDMDVLNGVVGVYATSITNSLSSLIAFIFKAPKIVLPCTTVPTVVTGYEQGDLLYYKSSTGKLDPASTGNTACAVILESAAAGDTTVLVRLDGTMAKA